MRGALFAFSVLFAAGSVMASEPPLPASALPSDDRSAAERLRMSYFSSSTSTLDVKSLPGMLSFHSAYITTGSFNPGTGQCNLFLAIEPTSSQVTYKVGLKGVDGNLLKNPSFRSDDVGSVYSALETTLTVMAANNKHPQKLKNYMAEAEEAVARRVAAEDEAQQ